MDQTDILEQGAENILLFDGVCNLCNWLVRFIIKRDRNAHFKFASLQSETAIQLLQRFDLKPGQSGSVVLISGDRVFQKSTAALRVLKGMPGFWKLLYVFIVVPRPLRDLVYDWIARSRYRLFGKRDECMIPSADLQSRFL